MHRHLQDPQRPGILLLGATGQVGQALLARAPAELRLLTPGRALVDFQTPGALAAAVARMAPQLVINCVAYNQVDGAEQRPALANRVNHLAVQELAGACGQARIPLVHFSTDYVFAGKDPALAPALYGESEATGPRNAYGHSKLAGERAALQSPANLVLRVSWVFSEYAKNMGQRILAQARAGQPQRVATDQYGSPTYAGHIAEVVWALAPALLAGQPGGLYHLSGTEAVSRYQLADALVAEARNQGWVAADYCIAAINQRDWCRGQNGQVADRPQWSALDSAALAQRLQRPLRPWRAALPGLVRALAT